MRKKKIVYHSDCSLAKTGFGRTTKCLLSYLYKTGKYDIVNYCCHIAEDTIELTRTPWKSIGSMPLNDPYINNTCKNMDGEQKDAFLRPVWYGSFKIDKVIQDEKPDCYFGVQDIWGVDYSITKNWFSKIRSVIWTTLDSLPILPSALNAAPKVDNYWIWSDFATKAMHEAGFNHIKTVHGPIDDKYFYPFNDADRTALRKKHNIDDKFIIGFVFRNQLRKSVPNLMEGYKLWKNDNPNVKSCLLLHTSFSEGWKIMDLAKEHGIPFEDIYTTYICKTCKDYFIHPFIGEDKDCPKCGKTKSLNTTNMLSGITEKQLNEVYNVMDVYCHPFTSGGQEIPIQEAKMSGLITLVTNYSCGEELCKPEAYSIPLKWESYREFGTQFIKATTLKESIKESIQIVYSMPIEERKKYGRLAREWAINNYSIGVIGPIFEKFIDESPFVDWSKPDEIKLKNPKASIDNSLDNQSWIKELYIKILDMKVDANDSGYNYWIQQLEAGAKRQDIELYFRNIAEEENKKTSNGSNNQQSSQTKLEDLLDKDDEDKRALYVMPEGIGDVFLSTALFRSFKETYKDWNLYVATQPVFFDVLSGNPHVHRVIPYTQEMDNLLAMEGAGKYKGYFKICFVPFITTQRALTYLHNGETKIAFDIKYASN